MIQKSISMTSKGTFTLPAKVRKALGLTKAGDRLILSYHIKNQTITMEKPADLQAVQARNSAYLAAHFTPEKLRQMAHDYHSGDGMAAAVEEKYGQRG